ncbi:MAG: hypothetical protein WCA91_21725 [Candidatus Acidiferrales bacterium]
MCRERSTFGERWASCCEHCKRRSRRQRVRRDVYGGRLHEWSVHRRHGLAAILTVMTVRRTRHGSTTLHGLLGRRYGPTVERIRCESDHDYCD